MTGCILSIETSTPRGGVAVVARDGAVLYEKRFTSERSHNSQLFGPLGEALEACGNHLACIVVGTGPASYTGVRIGIAAAQGIAMSRSVPVVGLPSVLAPELLGEASAFVMCGDARRGVYFVAEVRQGALARPLELMDAAGLREKYAATAAAEEMPGPAAGVSEGTRGLPWLTFDGKPPLDLSGVICVSPSASVLGRLAAQLTAADLARLAAAPLEPVYLAAPFITQPKGRAVSAPVM